MKQIIFTLFLVSPLFFSTPTSACEVSGSGINQIVGSIRDCLDDKEKKDEDGKDNDGDGGECSEGTSKEDCRVEKACKENPEGAECACGKDKTSDSCQLAKACDNDPISADCQCGRDPLSDGCETALNCENSTAPKDCFCGKLPDDSACNPGPIGGPPIIEPVPIPPKDVDPPESGGSHTGGGTDNGNGGNGGGSGANGESNPPPKTEENKNDSATEDADNGKKSGKSDSGKDRESLRQYAEDCESAVETAMSEVSQTSSPRGKADLCKAHANHANQCLKRVFDEDQELFKELNWRLGANSLLAASAWNCFCHYSYVDNLNKIHEAQDDPVRRFTLLQELQREHGECIKGWLGGAYDERMEPRVSIDSSGGSKPNHRFGEFGRKPFITKPFIQECESITAQLRDFTERAFSEETKQSYVRKAVEVASACDRAVLSGSLDERQTPPVGRDHYRLNKLCRQYKDMPECADYLRINN